MIDLKGKTALITGASRGIGRAIALLYADHGCNIAFTYITEDQEAEILIEELHAKNVEVLCLKSDASDFDAAHDVVKQVVDMFGRLDILVCNAGITRDTLLMRMSEQQWDDVLNVNLKSVFNYSHAAATQMMRQRSGCIIAMSSIVGMAGNAGQFNYAASKAGIIGLVKSLSKELGSRNIRVNAIAPGFIDTGMNNHLTEQEKQQIASEIPLQRLGIVTDVAQMTRFYVSGAADYVTGQIVHVNGGWYI